MNIYVGNMSYDTTEDELRAAFEEYGQVSSVKIITDKFTGRPRGFAFIEMPAQAEATTAMESLNNTELGGRKLRVNEARPREDRGGGRRGSRRGNRGGGKRRSNSDDRY